MNIHHIKLTRGNLRDTLTLYSDLPSPLSLDNPQRINPTALTLQVPKGTGESYINATFKDVHYSVTTNEYMD